MSEDCKYCAQSARYKTGLEKERLMEVQQVVETARKGAGSQFGQFCMGAAWKNPHERDMPYTETMGRRVQALEYGNLRMTLEYAEQLTGGALAKAGLDYYNHNLDTSPEFYGSVSYRDLSGQTRHPRQCAGCGIKVCSGGILEVWVRRCATARRCLVQLANLPAPESVPINMLAKIKGTPFEDNEVDPFDFVRAPSLLPAL